MWTSGSGIGEGLGCLVAIIGAACVALGGLIVWAAPIVWAWLKPIIHQATS